jgi:hypothetical protein
MNQPLNLSYWRWLFHGSNGKAGILRLLDLWLLFHVAVGIGLGLLVPLTLRECSNAVLLPLAGIIIGLTFAWAGNAQALLQTSEIEELGEQHKGGFEDYVFVYQMAIMLIFITLIVWCLAGLNVFDGAWPKVPSSVAYFGIKSTCFALSSIALRECWHVVLGAQWMLLMKREIKRIKNKINND